ncbi:MAG TPA: MarR family transcriptional regulator [Candidatus Limnocylindrales bacterium]|nr:MarR family transcriptional regulator [Candidatus Limnocylindrales bacterium]
MTARLPATPTISSRRLSARDPRVATWRRFLEAHARLERLLDEDLRAEHDLSLAEYDALLQLAEAPGRRLRMHQLADRVLLSRSGVTRLIDRLVLDGSVERDPCLTDARGAEAVLTPAGLARLRNASGTHLRGIADHFVDAIGDDDLVAVDRALRDVLASIEPDALEDRRTAG